MPIPATIRQFLDARLAEYDVLEHPRTGDPLHAASMAYVSPDRLVRARVLRDPRGLLVAVYPATHVLDLDKINRELRRDLKPVATSVSTALFSDCEPPLIPALSGAYGIKAVFDEAADDTDDVYFEVSHTALVRMRKRGLQQIQNAWHVREMSRPAGRSAQPATEAPTPVARESIKHRIQQISQLPAMPEMAQRILQLRANPYANIRDLARIIELDPSLASQVVRYARSPFFGFRGEVNSIQDAISRVMGYDMTMNIVLGIAVGRPFGNPPEGPLGLKAFWHHAIYCAALTQLLARSLPLQLRPKPGLAYLAGMLHNFGILLLGHLFRPEFYWLNKQVENRPQVAVTEIEHDFLGITHMELGTWLMEHWNLPAEVILSIQEHHNESYDGVHAVYPNLVLVANRLLKRVGIGDAETTILPKSMLRTLSLSEEQAAQVLAGVLDSGDGLNAIARQLAA